MVQRPPGPKGDPLLGMFRHIDRQRPGELFLDMVAEYGGFVYLKVLGEGLYIVADPALVQQILVTQRESFVKAPSDLTVLRRALGNGILVSEGDFHARQRRMIQPAFNHKRLDSYAQIMVDAGEALVASWRDEQVIDVAEAMMRVTLQIVAKALFDAEVDDETERFGHAIEIIQQASGDQLSTGFLVPEWLPTPSNRDIRRGRRDIDQIVNRLIADRRADPTAADRGDLLHMLLTATDEEGRPMPDEQINAELGTLFAAGHETTSNALTWTWYELDRNPDVADRLFAEVDAVLGDAPATLADLERLPYTEAVFKEAMRLHPPAWTLNAREPVTDVVIGGYEVPKGSLIMISPYALHRNPRLWDAPERFMPERFTADNVGAIPKYAYLPFGAGERVCIGNSFAMMEGVLLLATLARHVRFSRASDAPVRPLMRITMSPEGGLPMRVVQRQPIGAPV
jgi:cytochrome P450